MSFASPLFLWGMLAALLPLLVHLFDRRRPRPHPFGAIAFVLRSQRRTASRLKLRRLLLYTLRTLALLALPLALAQPECRRPQDVQAAVRGPAATAIVLDASLSMRYTNGTPLFSWGKKLALEALSDLLPEEPATVLVCGPTASAPLAPGFERTRMRNVLEEAEPSYGTADMSRCVEQAARALEESPLPGKRLVLISDFTRPAFRPEAPPPTLKGPDGLPVQPEVVLRDAAQGAKVLPNHALVDLQVEPALNVGPRSYAFTLTVRNFSPSRVKDLEATLRVGERVVAKGFVDLPPGGTAQKVFTHRFDSGGTVRGDVALTADALGEDDRRPFVLQVPRPLKALLVNGAPHAVRYRDETFFVEAALGAQGSPVEAHVRDVEAALREDWASYDLLCFFNVPAPPPEVAQRLATFVESGGGLWLSVGDQVDAESYNARLGAVLPRPLRLVKTAALPDEAEAEAKSARLADLRLDHPVLAPFSGAAREGLTGARFFRYMLLESTQGDDTVLAKFGDGAPALTVARRGKGRVALFTSTVDRDWGDLAIRTGFLPLVQRLSAYLAGALEERAELTAFVGETLTLPASPGQTVSDVTGPTGERLELRSGPDGTQRVGPLLTPGLYTARSGSAERADTQSFAVLLDPTESDLERLEPEALAASFGKAEVRTDAHLGEAPKVPLWSWLLVTVAVAFFLEGVLLRR